MKCIPLSVPNLKGKEKEYIMDAIEKEWVSTGGSYIDAFENNIERYLHVERAVACQSGTTGLHLSLILSGVERNDEVIVPTLTFIAAVNPVKYLGAHPIFMDCDDSLTIDTIKLRNFIEQQCEYINKELINKTTKRRIKAIVVVHVFGNASDMEEIIQIAKKYNLKVIEDATEALGSYFVEGRYKGKFLGTIADFGVYSFNGNKIITTGGGGMMVAKDQKLLEKAKYLSTQAKDDPLYYKHDEIGYNYRMTNLQAAVGVAQLEQLEDFISVKQRNFELYKQIFSECSNMEVLEPSSKIRWNHWFYSILIKNASISLDQFICKLHEKGVQTRPIWQLIHLQKPYELDIHYDIDKALYYQQNVINIPCSSNLSTEEVTYVAEAMKTILNDSR